MAAAKDSAAAKGSAAAKDSAGKGEKKSGDKRTLKKRRSAQRSYKLFLYNVHKQVHPKGLGLSTKTMNIMNCIMENVYAKLSAESGKLARAAKRKTLTTADLKAAVALLVPGEVAKLACVEGAKATSKYCASAK